MINFEKGNMFKLLDDPDYKGLFLVTANGVITKKGELVMGRGAAYQLKRKFDLMPRVFANLIRPHYNMGMESYGIVVSNNPIGYPFHLGLFQVKYTWKEPASLYLIKKSAILLNSIAHKFERVDLNFPGIGNGRLDKMQVLPILGTELTNNNNIHIWEL